MKKVLYVVLIGILVLSIYVPVSAPEGERVKVIIETDDVQALTNVINNAGGFVTAEFVSVPMVAADIPLLSLGDILSSSHCLGAWKDRIYTLPDVPEVSEGDNFEAMEIAEISSHVTGSYSLEDINNLPENYYNYLVTGAHDVWGETHAGDGTLVAVIDTGIYPWHPCLYPRVIGGACFADDCDEYPWWDYRNHPHGTFCSGVIASNCEIHVPVTDVLADAITRYAPPESWRPDPDDPDYIYVPLLGMAPLAELYAIKVFPHDGSGVPVSVIMQGIDHAINMRKWFDATNGEHGYPIDVISMSLGGPNGFDGHDPEDRLVDEATKAGIVVSVAAGNSGPALNTIEAPGTARTSISVGAAADAVHTRVALDLIYGVPDIGWYMYPSEEMQVIYFSSHGPTSDGRCTPDVLACGVYAFSCFPTSSVGFMSGTSAACPVVSGAAALLANWQKLNEGVANPYQIRNAIIEGAVPLDKPYSVFAQGNGYLNVPNSLTLIQNGIDGGLHLHSGCSFEVTDLKGGTTTWSTGDLEPGIAFDIAIEVDEDTEKLDIWLSNVVVSGPHNPLIGDSIEFYVQDSVRTYGAYIFDSINVYGDAYFTVYDPCPGNVRIVIEGDWTNWGLISCDVTVKETEGKATKGGHKEVISNDEWHQYTIEVPEGLGSVVFELWWMHDWSMWPTYDLDMYVITPDSSVLLDGATLLAPEKQIITNPTPGTYVVLIYGYEIFHGKDPYQLNVYFIT